MQVNEFIIPVPVFDTTGGTLRRVGCSNYTVKYIAHITDRPYDKDGIWYIKCVEWVKYELLSVSPSPHGMTDEELFAACENNFVGHVLPAMAAARG